MNYTPFLFVCSIIVVRCFYYCAMLLLPLSQPCEYDEQNFHERRAHQPSLTSFKTSQCCGLMWQTKRTMRINWMFQGYHHCVSFHCNNWVSIRFFFLKGIPPLIAYTYIIFSDFKKHWFQTWPWPWNAVTKQTSSDQQTFTDDTWVCNYMGWTHNIWHVLEKRSSFEGPIACPII